MPNGIPRNNLMAFDLIEGVPWGLATMRSCFSSIRTVFKKSHFHGEGDRKVWACQRFRGPRTSKARVLKWMR